MARIESNMTNRAELDSLLQARATLLAQVLLLIFLISRFVGGSIEVEQNRLIKNLSLFLFFCTTRKNRL